MLGAQALRTKQKVEQREKEKRHREKLKNLELQRERIQKVAREEDLQDAILSKISHLNIEDAQALIEIAAKSHSHHHHHHQQRHSLHAANGHHAVTSTPLSARHSPTKEHSIEVSQQRSPSQDYGRTASPGREAKSSGGGSRLMRWLGISNSDLEAAKKSKRRMSSY